MIKPSEKTILRELAKKYSEIAQSERQTCATQRMRDTNNLKIVRPPVLIDEIPWQQMDIDSELTTFCETPFAKQMEMHFRRHIFAKNHFFCDILAENIYPITKSFTREGWDTVAEETIATSGEQNTIVSHIYHDRLADEAALEEMQHGVITLHPEKDAENMGLAEEILCDIIPIQLRGVSIYAAPWDVIPRMHGVDNTLMDLAVRPDFMHKVIKKFIAEEENLLNQYENLGLLDPRIPALHCTPSYVNGVPAEDYDGGSYRAKDVWYRTMAQIFGSVSPQMHEEFDIQYSLPLMKRCAYTYYGCCEPLDNKMDILKKIPNLRKVGVSPWANPEKCAEQIGGDYVMSAKPNPANVAIKTDPQVVRAEIIGFVEAAQKHNCPIEFVLKDISTVNGDPQNLILWSKTVSEVLDEYY